ETPKSRSPSGIQTPSPLQRTWTIWLSNGMRLRNAAQVLGAKASSKRASKVKSPAWTTSWLIRSVSQRLRKKCRDEPDCSGAAKKQAPLQAPGGLFQAHDAAPTPPSRAPTGKKPAVAASDLLDL